MILSIVNMQYFQRLIVPISYIDKIETKKHLMLVYDDIKKGREIECHFLRRGLERDEQCIYLTHDDPKLIESEMERYGINVRHYKKNKLLHVDKMPNLVGDYENILIGMQNMMKHLPIDPKTPFRIVGRVIPDVGFEVAMAVEYHIEKTLQTLFDELNGSILCTYDFSQIQSNNQWRDWLAKLESCHHATLLNICEKSQVKITA